MLLVQSRCETRLHPVFCHVGIAKIEKYAQIWGISVNIFALLGKYLYLCIKKREY